MTEGFVAKHRPLAPYTLALQSSLQASLPSTTVNVTNAGESPGRGLPRIRACLGNWGLREGGKGQGEGAGRTRARQHNARPSPYLACPWSGRCRRRGRAGPSGALLLVGGLDLCSGPLCPA